MEYLPADTARGGKLKGIRPSLPRPGICAWAFHVFWTDWDCPEAFVGASCCRCAATPLQSLQPFHSDEVERISVGLIEKDKEAVGKLAGERRVSIAWVVREAVLEFPDRQSPK